MNFDIGTILFLTAIFVGLYSTIYCLLTVYEHWGRHKSKIQKKNFPSVCVIVPCYNEEKTVAKTLNSLLNLDYPKTKLEIIVVDDGSKDATYKVAKEFANRGVKVYKKKNGGKHTALNYALKKTSAQFVGALDADSTVASDALKKIVPYFDDARVMAVTPSMIIDTPQGFLRRIQSIEFLLGTFLRRVFTDVGSQHVTPGPFTIYRKLFFETYGYYREAHMTEDIEVALRIQTHDFLIENATDAYVYTHGPSSWNGLYKQRLRWYHGFISNVLDYKHLFGPRHGNLGLFVLPMCFISLAVMTLVLIYTLARMIFNFVEHVYHYWLIGFDFWRLLEWNFDSFFINTGPLSILGAITLIGGIVVIMIAKHYTQEKRIIVSYVLFAIFYSWLYVFWWAAALYHKVFKRNVGWGHKSMSGG